MLIVSGIIVVYKADAHSEQEPSEPLPEILQCVKAAAAGDTSCLPENRSKDEFGELSQAVGRLITVLARSENLVYHQAALIESSGEAIISCTLEGTILSWNKGAQRIYGYSAEAVKGRPITLLSPCDQGAELRLHLESIRKGEKMQPFETLHEASNGRTVKALVRLSAVLDSTRKAIGVSYCAQDLTGTERLNPKTIEGQQIV
jgi:PAS domain S-box-containing protein